MSVGAFSAIAFDSVCWKLLSSLLKDIFVELFEDSDFSGERDLNVMMRMLTLIMLCKQNEEIPVIMREIPMEQPWNLDRILMLISTEFGWSLNDVVELL